MLQNGEILGGMYQVIGEIGKGGSGIIYLGYHLRLQKQIVIKKIKDINVGQINTRIEADILKKLHHRYLPQVYDFLEMQDGIYTIIDYIPGHDLSYYLGRNYNFPEETILKWMHQMCEVLEYLHSQKPPILHSDIKPGNIMVTENDDICLIDFNVSLDGEVSKELQGLSRSYAAPEQFQYALDRMYGKHSKIVLDARMDIYSMGAVFYRLMTGWTPDAESGMPYSIMEMNLPYMLNGIEDGSLLVNNLKETPKKETLQKSGELSFNQNFFQKLESFTYQDYEREYGGLPEIVKVKNGEVEVVHKNLSATCFYANTSEHGDVVDTKTDTPDKTGMPEKIVVDDISLLFKNFTGEITIDELQSICGSKVDIVNKKERSYVEFESGSALIRIESDENGTISSSTAWNEIILTNANKNRTAKKSVFSGIVLNAMTSEGVEAANISLEAQGDSSHSANIKTEMDGSFSIELEADTYNITISAENYEEETFEFTIEENSNYSGEQFTISPSLASGSARIVLEWGDYPEDLDSYLIGTTDDGTEVDVSFHNDQCTKNGEVIAELDVDEMDGHGPETITLNNLNGTYRYLVDDFTESGKLQEYGATVKVYISGKSQPEVITIAPDAGVKNVWEVFELDHGKLNILNRAAVEDYE